MSHICVCGGSNENCRFCGGLGTVADNLGTALEGLQQVAIERGIKGSRKLRSKSFSRGICPSRRTTDASDSFILVTCTKCGKSLKVRELNQHVNALHGNSSPPEIQKPLSVLKKVREYQSCTICIVKLRIDHVVKHMRRVHGKPLRPAPVSPRAYAPISKIYKNVFRGFQRESFIVPDSADSPKPERGYEFCPICKVRLKAGRLQKHKKKVHNRNTAGGRKVVLQSSKDVQRDKTSLVAPRDKNLDATRLYAHSYREQGRFGSHPSHDGFDDESGPDENR